MSFAALVLVGIAGPSAAKPDLGPRGWAPGTLAWAPSSWVATALLWAGYLLGAAGVLVNLRRGPVRSGWWVPLGLAVIALLTGPFGSPDHTVYAAYGRVVTLGADPYLAPPSQALAPSDPLLALVDDPWQDTVSIYGPVATVLQAFAALVGGDSMRQVVWVWQVVVVAAWLGVRWLLVRAAAVEPRRVDALWTLNPLVFGVGVLGAHVDLVAAALAVAALVALTRSLVLAGILTGLAVSTKVTYAVVGLAVLLAWWAGRRPGGLWRLVRYAAPAVVVAAAAHWWAGPHVFDQLSRVRDSVSFATPWRLLLEVLRSPLGESTARSVVSLGALLVFGVLALVLARLTRGLAGRDILGVAARWTLVLATAYAWAAPYSLPWYDLLTWVALPLVAASVLDLVALGHLLVMCVAYVPGRVTGMSARVEDITMGVRRRVGPWLGLAVWGWVTLAARRGSWRSRAPRPPAP